MLIVYDRLFGLSYEPCHVVNRCTTSQIDRHLPVEFAVAWRNRNAVDHVIILDWKCSATKLDPQGSVACLKDALVKVLPFVDVDI